MSETLKDYTKIVVETDEENPTTIAEITEEAVNVADGYRVRLTPYVFVPEDRDGIRGSDVSNPTASHSTNRK